MSDNETTEMWREHRQHVQKQRWNSLERNASVLRSCHLPLVEKNMGTVFLLRGSGYRKVSYWPSSEMWMIDGSKNREYGNAKAFIKWCMGKKARLDTPTA